MGNRLYLLVVALIVVLGGIAYSIVFMIKGITSIPGDLQRVVIPGESSFSLDKPDNYTIFYEYKSFLDGRIYASGADLGTFTVKITAPDGSEVPLAPASVSSTYDMGSYSGYAVYTFDAPSAGTYSISGTIDDFDNESAGTDIESSTQTNSQQRAVLSIGKDFMGKIFGLVFGTLGLVFGSLLVGGTIIVVMLVGMLKSARVQQ